MPKVSGEAFHSGTTPYGIPGPVRDAQNAVIRFRVRAGCNEFGEHSGSGQIRLAENSRESIVLPGGNFSGSGTCFFICMKTDSSAEEEKGRAVANRPVGPIAEKLPAKQKKLMNLKEESQHQTGKERLASEETVREVDGSSKE